ncbi:MAG: hypothetical protein PHN45_02350 [Methylococcales bacterium]|nr:hypothetical protein [Methylococcales bacterium]
MNHRKMFSAVILFILTQFAWGISSPEYIGTPYYDISTKKPKLLNENTTRSGQISVYDEVDFFEIVNTYTNPLSPFPLSDVELVFSCPQADSKVSMFGWYVSVWKHYSDTSKADEKLKGYDQVSQKKCSDKFTFFIDQNDNEVDKVASYYIGIQSACSTFPKRELKFFYMDTSASISQPQECDTSDYKLKLGLIPKEIAVDTNTLTADQLKNAISLGSIKTGKVTSNTDNNVYSVETYSTQDTSGTNEVPLLFSCTATAARQTNDWKLTVYDDKNTVVAGYPRFINGSDCGSTLVDDKGGFKFTLPKDSPRYFVSVQSACDSQSKKKCTVDSSQYNIARDVTKIYTGNLYVKNITATTAIFKLTRCGLNSSSTIAVKVDNADLRAMFKVKMPMKIQIWTMACQILTPDSFSPAELMLGSITGNAEFIDASLIAKDSATVTLGECVSSNAPNAPSKITLTGTKLDLEDLNPSQTTTVTTPATATAATSSNNSVVIPVKVDIGDFHCEGKDAFYVDADKPNLGDKTYSNHLPTDIEDYSPAVNLELSKTGKIESITDVQLYYVDSSINSDTKLDFSCDTSMRFNNDWKLSVYNSDKTLNGKPYVINGSDCGTGKDGDNGTYKITIPKATDSVRYYVAVKSACDVDDNACIIDKTPYTLSREFDSVVSATGNFDVLWLTTKNNLGATLQSGKINALTDAQVYQIDTGTEDANLTFSCLNAVRYQNDWKVLIYDSAKLLKSTTMINGSSCGMGQLGDSGAYAISLLTKDSPTYYLVVKSACDISDPTCVVDSSQYQLKRVTPAQATANAATKPCSGIGCKIITTVKPFFN